MRPLTSVAPKRLPLPLRRTWRRGGGRRAIVGTARTAALVLALLAPASWSFGARAPRRGVGEPKTPEAWIEQAERSRDERWSVFVKDLETSATILDYHGDERLVPASNRKVMIFALALEVFGPEYRFKTELGTTGRLDRETGTVRGSLVLRSKGDPTMDSRYLSQKNPAAVLRGWVAGLRRSGIRRIEGDCIVDASAFGAEQDVYPAAWDASYRSHGYAMPPSAIALNDNLVRISVKPAANVGGRGRVSLYPSGEGIDVDNETRTTDGGIEGLDGKFASDGQTLVLTGRLGEDVAEHVISVPLAAPLAYVLAILQSALKDEGIKITGQTKVVTDRAEAREYGAVAVQAWHESIPLVELLRIMLRNSDNFLAEQLWRAAAHHARGDGSPLSARRLEEAWCREHGLTWIEPGRDGSGLSRENRIAASELVGVLEAVYASPYRVYLLDCLPASGRSGTLRGRSMGVTPGRVVAKTGTLAGASSLSGFMMDERGRPRWAFAFLANAPGDTNGRLTARGDQIMKILLGMLDAGRQPKPAPPPVREKKYKPGTKTPVGSPT